jgi:long-chain-fatty-acid--[acyl-carrier-protein] ligase
VRFIIENFIIFFFRFVFWFRYRITFKGLENLTPENLNKPGGVLFLPNHPAVFTDPVMVTLGIWRKYPIRPLIVEYMYNLPVINSLMRYVNALPVPDLDQASNTLKKKRSDKAITDVIEGLKRKENFLIYPAGRTKNTSMEIIGGASGVHRIISDVPQVNVVLVRMIGMWGSSFSRAIIGRAPPLFPTVWQGIKIALKNLLFFTPRREIVIEYHLAPDDFPYKGSRLTINRWLENWYNQPDGLSNTPQQGDTLVLVSYSFWRDQYPKVYERPPEILDIDLNQIPDLIKNQVVNKIAEFTEIPKDQITPEKTISIDLGLDSLDTAELVMFLEDQYDVENCPAVELTTVGKMMAIASKQIVFAPEVEEKVSELDKWKQSIPRVRLSVPDGKTIPEVFLTTCKAMGKQYACADLRSGILSYHTLELRTLILAEYIRKLPGQYIGILLPASVGATMCFLAVLIAGKIPVMINWTVGPRHLESVMSVSGTKTILSSWAFIDRLANVDLTNIEDSLLMLEDVRKEIGLLDKIKGFLRTKMSVSKLLKTFNIEQKTENDAAVLLFTSGTESMPKGVPLTHGNILSNQRAVVQAIDFYTTDIIFGILPPFHSFGLTVSSLTPLMIGARVAFYPDPTDGKQLAKGIDRWLITIICGAPTFLKKMLKAAKPEQLKSLRYLVTGAEKAPPELFQLCEQMGVGDIVIEGYGITECSPVLSMNRPNQEHKGVGLAAPGIELLVINPESKEVLGPNQEGLILARGPNVFHGYINKGLASPFMTINNKEWYITGDMGNIDDKGYLFITGRLKRFIKVGPEMISLAAIEDALLQAAPSKGWDTTSEEGPALAVCAKEIPGEKPKIYVFARFKTTTDELNRTLKEAGFANLVKISNFQQLEELPIMGTGKIHYRDLETKYLT